MSDSEIISLLQQHDPKVWELVYDNYSAVMYGIVYRLAGDKKIAEQLFSKAFVQLKNEVALIREPLLSSLIRYTYRFTSRELVLKQRPVYGFDLHKSPSGFKHFSERYQGTPVVYKLS